MGGVLTGRDAFELLAAGATHIAVGTTLFGDPGAPGRIRAELQAELERNGFATSDEASGLAHAPACA